MFQEPSAPPLNIVAKAPEPDASTSLEVTWNPPASTLANGVITGYKLYYMKSSRSSGSAIDAGATKIDIDDPDQTKFQIDSLEVYTQYKVWMKASTAVGDGPSSSPVIGRTGEDGKWANVDHM